MKISLCNYYGMCDAEGNVMGHPVKVTKEYFNLLQGDFEISVIASPCICATLAESNISAEELTYDIRADLPFTICKRILDKIKVLSNVRSCTKKESDVLFFLQVDFFFFLYLWMCYRKKGNKKVYCLIYHQCFTVGKLEPLFQSVYRKALKKIDGVFYTQKNTPVEHFNSRWIPDYFFDEVIYSQYRKNSKENQICCLGTMNRYKQLEQIVEIWQADFPKLLIAGKFDDENRYDRLVTKVLGKANIVIRNEVIPFDEYYSILGSSKYSILPYDMKQYINRTSGVIQESIFLGSIPIAPKMLIEQNNVCGVGYEMISDVAQLLYESNFDNIYYEMDNIIRLFSKDYVREQFKRMFDNYE